MAKNLFNRYISLIEYIDRGQRTLQDIQRFTANSHVFESIDGGGYEIPERTFHNYRKAIAEHFEIDIECEKATNRYYIDYPINIDRKRIKEQIIDNFSMHNRLREFESLGARVAFEKIPSSGDNLRIITEAMQQECTLKIDYNSFWGLSGYERGAIIYGKAI